MAQWDYSAYRPATSFSKQNKTINMEKTAIKGNKLIAEFMGGKHNGGSYYKFYYGIDIVGVEENCRPDSWIETNLKYHTSWDWLMPVVTKIKDYVLIEKPYEGLLDKVDVLNLYITAPINTVWEQCVYAIKFINSQYN